MYTILVYYLYILLALVAFGVIGYVAITYFALLQRVLLRIARGGLRRIAVDENDDVKGFKLEHLDQCMYFIICIELLFPSAFFFLKNNLFRNTDDVFFLF